MTPVAAAVRTLTASAGPLAVALTAISSVVVCALVVRRVHRLRVAEPTGVLEASRLSRPPRLLLGI